MRETAENHGWLRQPTFVIMITLWRQGERLFHIRFTLSRPAAEGRGGVVR
jgi:hypothetical protein